MLEKLKKFLKEHKNEVLVGVAMGVAAGFYVRGYRAGLAIGALPADIFINRLETPEGKLITFINGKPYHNV